MKLCLCFHCLCDSYEEAPSYCSELFVSLADMRQMVEQLLDRGYRFASADDPGDNTVTVTFDDGYYNNVLFRQIAGEYNIPFIVFVSAYYLQSGDAYPWLAGSGKRYNQMHDFDYYAWRGGAGVSQGVEKPGNLERPMTFEELAELRQDGNLEIGCHGYYHQPLSSGFEKYLSNEVTLGVSTLQERLGVKPKYYALANGIYTKRVVEKLLIDFDRVFTIEGRPFRSRDTVIHRLTLGNPSSGVSLIEQIDRHLKPARRLRRAIRTYGRLGF